MSAPNKRKRGDAEPATGDQETQRAALPPSLRPERNGLQSRGDGKKMAVACKACRKQKIKCDMPTKEPPCTRCQRRNLARVLDSAARPGSVDPRQVGHLRKDVQNLHAAIDRVCQHLDLEPPTALESGHETAAEGRQPATTEDAEDPDLCELSPPESPSALQAPIDTFLENPQGQANEPSPRSQRRKTTERFDLVTKSLVTLDAAETLVHKYLTRLDPILYSIASRHKDIESVRRASPTLLAGMCAVSALHSPDDREAFEICNKECTHLVSSSLFEKRDTEFVRGLCIGSFWLLGASRILSSDAMRRAADVRLYRQFSRLENLSPTNSPEEVAEVRDRVRLDCLTKQEQDLIERRDSFLVGNDVIKQDVRIISQVSLLHIMGQIRDAFGSEIARPLSKGVAVQFSYFAKEVDMWYAQYSPRSDTDNNIGDFPATGLYMHWQFAKLYLGNHVFRELKDLLIPIHFLPAATTAYEAAKTIFRIVLENEDFRDNLVGVPHYFHIMISFAGRFVLEVCKERKEQLNAQVDEDLHLMRAVLAPFVRMPTLPQHPLTRVTAGLMRQSSACITSMGLENVMTGNPFGLVEGQYDSAQDLCLPGTSTSQMRFNSSADSVTNPTMP